LSLTLLRAVKEDYQFVDDGGSVGLWRDVGRDEPFRLDAQRFRALSSQALLIVRVL
jgi:hypothetical protein